MGGGDADNLKVAVIGAGPAGLTGALTVVARRSPRLEILLGLSIAALVVQLAWPELESWWNHPTPGRQVPQSVELAEHGQVRYLVYLPRKYERAKEMWPLVVYLHGSGLRGNNVDLVATKGPPMFAAAGRDLPFILVSPHCGKDRSWEPDAIHALTEYIAANYDVARDQMYLTGYSMGGYGTWATAAAYPEQFAAIVPLCGSGNPEDADQLASVPVWAFHGREDEIVPLSASEEMVRAVRDAGGSAKLTIIPDRGHDICDRAFREEDLFAWLLAQHRDSSPATEQ